MGFERFDKTVAQAVNKDPEVTVLPDGIVSMTWKAYEMLGEPKTVEFYFDRSRKLMGLAPAEDDSNGYMVRLPKTASKGRVSVRGAAVFKYYEINLSAKHRAIPRLEDGLLTFPVQQDDSEISAPRSAPQHDQSEETNLA